MKAMQASLTVLAVALLLALAGCVGPTPYQPMADGRYGYDSQALEQNRFRVSFAGNTATPRRTVEDYLLHRAAELTLEEGGEHFIVVYRETDRHGNYPESQPGWNTSFGIGSCWGCGWSSGASTGVVFGAPASDYPRERYQASIEIVVRQGPPPAGDAHAYDARELIRRLGPGVVRKKDG